MLEQAFLAGAKNLENNKDWINDLNVFPVPDGDTGTNMTLTIMSAVKEIGSLPDLKMKHLAKAISSGSLRGARGNSGVILSQLLRGFTREISDVEVITAMVGAKALQRATETAYKAVMKPKEGTILTVARSMSDKALEIIDKTPDIDLDELLEQVIACGDETLEQTPELLPVLKQAGVVDSGGQGLMQVMKGALKGMRGEETVEIPEEETQQQPVLHPEDNRLADLTNLGEIRYGYCTEFIINLDRPCGKEEQDALNAYLQSIGDSVVFVPDDDFIKVHVHTNDPGQAITKGLTYGSLTGIKIDNMREQNRAKKEDNAARLAAGTSEKPAESRKEVGFVSVSSGEGMAEILTAMNVDEIIEGGQTMNPSTEDVLEAIERVNADVIYVFPNNPNVVLAAEQAANLVKDRRVVVIPSKTIPQGITALINFSPVEQVETNIEMMTDSMKQVKTGEVTYAVRTTVIDEQEIHEGDLMGLGDHSTLLSVGDDADTVAADMIDAMVDEETELISIYYGEEIDEEKATRLERTIADRYPDLDVEAHYGGQPIYYYIISAE